MEVGATPSDQQSGSVVARHLTHSNIKPPTTDVTKGHRSREGSSVQNGRYPSSQTPTNTYRGRGQNSNRIGGRGQSRGNHSNSRNHYYEQETYYQSG